MHGGARGNGGPPGERNGAFRHGRFSQQTKEVSKLLRAMAKDADVMTATVMSRNGLRPLKALRRKVHVRRALAKTKEKAKGENT
jgi:hypothetical protein